MPGGAPPLWWTETGFDTGNVAGTNGYQGIEGGITGCAHGSETDQASRLAAIMNAAKTSPHVAGSFNFLLVDESDLAHWQTGLFRPDGTPKPSFYAYQTALETAR